MKTILVIGSLILFLACQKRINHVDDPPISFSLSFGEAMTNSDGLSEVHLKRKEISEGKPVSIHVEGQGGIKQVEKILKCGPLESRGQTRKAPDVDLFSFYISSVEFPGIEQFPKRVECEVSLRLTNSSGSTTNRSFPLVLVFDSIPSGLSAEYNAREPGLFLVPTGHSYLLEEISFSNTLSYSVHVSAQASGAMRCPTALRFQWREGDECYQEGPNTTACVPEKITAKVGERAEQSLNDGQTILVESGETVRFQFWAVSRPTTGHEIDAIHLVKRWLSFKEQIGIFIFDQLGASEIMLHTPLAEGVLSHRTSQKFERIPKGVERRSLPVNNSLMAPGPRIRCNLY